MSNGRDHGFRWLRSWIAAAAVSVLLLVPCFWLPRVHAGDFSSHVYNARLAELAESGSIDGVTLVQPWTNFLFDLLLGRMIAILGLDLAQRFALGLLVLLFFWGAFNLARVTSGRSPWFLVPCLAVIAYGVIFQAGFCNFYLAAALCMWAAALFCTGRLALRFGAGLILVVAIMAHALPVAWTLLAGSYVAIIKRVPARLHPYGLAIAIGSCLILRVAIPLPTYWTAHQAFTITGADQAWLWGTRYYALAVALLAVWVSIFSRQRAVRLSIPVQVYLITAAAALILPTRIDLPGFAHALVYLADRLSLAAAVTACVVLARAVPSTLEVAGLCSIAAVFFSFLYVDSARLARVEEGVERAVRALPPGSRVIGAIGLCEPRTRFDPLAHAVDRACTGHCFSYANAEPSTRQFRVRAASGNGVVASSYGIVNEFQTGRHVITADEAPVYELSFCSADATGVCATLLRAGDRTRKACVPRDWPEIHAAAGLSR